MGYDAFITIVFEDVTYFYFVSTILLLLIEFLIVLKRFTRQKNQ